MHEERKHDTIHLGEFTNACSQITLSIMTWWFHTWYVLEKQREPPIDDMGYLQMCTYIINHTITYPSSNDNVLSVY